MLQSQTDRGSSPDKVNAGRRGYAFALALIASLSGTAALSGLAIGASPALAAEAAPPLPQLYVAPLPLPSGRPTQEFDNGVRMFGDITYSNVVGYRPLKLDLYLPAGSDVGAPLPVVLWFHGGGYQIGNPRADWTWGDWSAVLARLSARGYAVAGVTYRFKREAPFPAQLDDAHAALAFLRGNAGMWNLDKQRIYAWGLSAGAHLSSMVAVKSEQAPAEHKVAGAVEWFGSTDFASNRSERSLKSHSSLLGCDGICPDEIFAQSSPVNFVSSKTVPILIVQGVEDQLVPVEQGDALYARMKKVGAPVSYDRMEGMSHGFEGGTSVQQEAILMRTFAFFDSLSGKNGDKAGK